MRILVLTALLLLPTVLALPPASLTPPLPNTAVVNGGFEAGYSGWTPGSYGCSTCQIITPGAQGTGHALLATNRPVATSKLQQPLPASLAPAQVLDFWAHVTGNAANPYYQFVIVRGSPNSGHDLTAAVAIGAQRVRVFLGTWGDSMTMAYDNTGDWHHYQVVLVPAAGIAVLFVDGNLGGPLAAASGFDPNPHQTLIVGDDDGSTPATDPDVAFDEIYYGPLV